MSRALRPIALALATLALVTALAACGDSGGTADDVTTTADGKLAETTSATLVLDFLPNPIHAGIYRALEAGYYRDRNIDLRVIQPTSTADTLRLIDAGKADFGLADGLDLADQIGRGLDIEAFMAIVQRPLGGVITRAQDGISSGRRLEGETVGATGVPSDRAVLDTVVESDGGDPSKVKVVTIGFNGAQNLQNGKVAGFLGYWPSDGTQLDVGGTRTRTLKLDEHGGPVYPGLVAFSTRAHLRRDPALVRAFAAATVAGYEDAMRDPDQALDALLARNRTLRRPLARAQLAVFERLYQGDADRFGTLDPAHVEALSAWMVETGLAARPFSAARFGGDDYLPAAGG